MPGRLAALYRHPVKGFTPERLDRATLEAGACFPGDRRFAVENGPSGYDPAAPVFLAKTNFTVLASIPALARARTRFDDRSGVLTVEALGAAPARFALGEEGGRADFAAWLEGFIDAEERRGPLRVLEARGPHRFTDDPRGAVSLINLESLRDLERCIGRPVDARRFRANLHVEGWAPWSELDLQPGAEVRVGETVLRVVKPIARCAATHVGPTSGERDLDVVPSLFQAYGRITCGLYLQVAWGGEVVVGDPAGRAQAPALAGLPGLPAPSAGLEPAE
jgi:uncharacterized protein YcbX